MPMLTFLVQLPLLAASITGKRWRYRDAPAATGKVRQDLYTRLPPAGWRRLEAGAEWSAQRVD